MRVLLLATLITAVFRAAIISVDEAETLYIVRDSIELSLADGPRTLLNSVRAELTTTFDRANAASRDPFYHLLLDVWTFVAGDLLFSVRWFSLLWVPVALALLWRLLHRYKVLSWIGLPVIGFTAVLGVPEAGWWLFLIGVAITVIRIALDRVTLDIEYESRAVLFRISSSIGLTMIALWIFVITFTSVISRPNWQQFPDLIAEQRDQTQPLLVTYDAVHPLAAIDHEPQTHFTTGVVIETGWREDRDPAEVVATLADTPVVWVLRDSPEYYAALSATHTPIIARADEFAGIELVRFELNTPEP